MRDAGCWLGTVAGIRVRARWRRSSPQMIPHAAEEQRTVPDTRQRLCRLISKIVNDRVGIPKTGTQPTRIMKWRKMVGRLNFDRARRPRTRLTVIGFTGRSGGDLVALCDLCLRAGGCDPAHPSAPHHRRPPDLRAGRRKIVSSRMIFRTWPDAHDPNSDIFQSRLCCTGLVTLTRSVWLRGSGFGQ